MKSVPPFIEGTGERLAHSVLTKALADASICKGLYICSTGRKVAPVGLAADGPRRPRSGRVVQILGGVPKSGGVALNEAEQPPRIWAAYGKYWLALTG